MFEYYNINSGKKEVEDAVKVNTLEHLHAFKHSDTYESINKIIIPIELFEESEIHTLFFIGKTLILDCTEITNVDDVIVNPMIGGVYGVEEIPINREVTNHESIPNKICHINVNEILLHNEHSIEETIIDSLKKVWTYFIAFNICNLPSYLDNDTMISLYKSVAQTFGSITKCFPVNKLNATKVISRDIKYTPNIQHFYASNIRQPFHNDYAHYPIDMAPDWLMLYSLEQSKYGGITSLISIDTVKEILEEFNPALLEKISDLDVTYSYFIKDRTIQHRKKLLTSNMSNWNYFQIKEEYNSEEIMSIRTEFFKFLEDTIVAGQIYDFSKNWKRGDCVIFNDHRMMHCRSAFLGSRWLKDYAFKDNILM